MSDIEYLAIKEFENKTRIATADNVTPAASTETDVLTLTATTGRDMYFAHADITVRSTSAGTAIVTVRFYLNGIVVSKRSYRLSSEGSTPLNIAPFLSMRGKKVASGQIMKITVEVANETSAVDGALIVTGKLQYH